MESFNLNPPLSVRQIESDHGDLVLPDWDGPILSENDIASAERLASIEPTSTNVLSDLDVDFINDIDDVPLLEMLSSQEERSNAESRLFSLLLGNTAAELEREKTYVDISDIVSMELENGATYSWDSNQGSANSLTFSSESEATRFGWLDTSSSDGHEFKRFSKYDNIHSEDTADSKEINDKEEDDEEWDGDVGNRYPGIKYEWLVEIVESAEGLCFKLRAEGGAYMKLHRNEIVESIESLLVESENSGIKFLVKFVDDTLAVVDGYKIVDIVSTILQDSPCISGVSKGVLSGKVQDNSSFCDDDLSVLQDQRCRTLPAVVPPSAEEIDDSRATVE